MIYKINKILYLSPINDLGLLAEHKPKSSLKAQFISGAALLIATADLLELTLLLRPD